MKSRGNIESEFCGKTKKAKYFSANNNIPVPFSPCLPGGPGGPGGPGEPSTYTHMIREIKTYVYGTLLQER